MPLAAPDMGARCSSAVRDEICGIAFEAQVGKPAVTPFRRILLCLTPLSGGT